MRQQGLAILAPAHAERRDDRDKIAEDSSAAPKTLSDALGSVRFSAFDQLPDLGVASA